MITRSQLAEITYNTNIQHYQDFTIIFISLSVFKIAAADLDENIRIVSNSWLLSRGVLWPPTPCGQRVGAGGGVPVRGCGGVLVFQRLHHGGR